MSIYQGMNATASFISGISTMIHRDSSSQQQQQQQQQQLVSPKEKLIKVDVEDPESGSGSDESGSSPTHRFGRKTSNLDLEDDVSKSFLQPTVMSSSAGKRYPITSCLMYAVTSIAMVLFNKIILTSFNFKYEMVLLFAQNLICMVLLRIARTMGLCSFEDFDMRKAVHWLPLNVFFVFMLLTGFYSLQMLSVPMVTIFKNSANVLVTTGDYLFYGQTVTPGVVACLALIVAAASFAAANDITLDTMGIFWAVCNCVVSAAYVLYMPQAMERTELSSFGKVYYNSALSLPLVILLDLVAFRHFSGFFSSSDIFGPYLTMPFLVTLVVSGILGFGISFASFNCVRQTSPTTYAMVGSMNKIPLSVLGVVIFNTPITAKSGIFITISLFAGILYAYTKAKQTKPKSPAASGTSDSLLARKS